MMISYTCVAKSADVVGAAVANGDCVVDVEVEFFTLDDELAELDVPGDDAVVDVEEQPASRAATTTTRRGRR